MKKLINKTIKRLLVVFYVGVFFLTSCEYEEIRDADIPEPVVYMPAAARGIFVIDNVPRILEFHPTPGYPYEFLINNEDNKFTIPLSVYRSGFEHNNSVDITISSDTDTVTNLISLDVEEGGLPDNTGILSSEHYVLPTSVTVPKGNELGSFNLGIDLNHLLASPDTSFALSVVISSNQIDVNPELNTTIIVIHTKILYPKADFGYNIASITEDTAIVNFENTSVYAMKYLWDFDDGETDTLRTPVHYYTSSGTYDISLTATGVVGARTQDEQTISVEILLDE